MVIRRQRRRRTIQNTLDLETNHNLAENNKFRRASQGSPPEMKSNQSTTNSECNLTDNSRRTTQRQQRRELYLARQRHLVENSSQTTSCKTEITTSSKPIALANEVNEELILNQDKTQTKTKSVNRCKENSSFCNYQYTESKSYNLSGKLKCFCSSQGWRSSSHIPVKVSNLGLEPLR